MAGANTEGSRRRSPNDFAHFLNLAESSMAETEYHLLLCRDLGYLDPVAAKTLMGEAGEIPRMLYSFRVKVEQGDRAGNRQTDDS